MTLVPSRLPAPAAARTLDLWIAGAGAGRFRIEARADTQASAVAEVAADRMPSETLAGLFERPSAREELRRIGQDLFDALFADDVGCLFERLLGEVSGDGERVLRLRLRIDPPELAILPWELLYSRELDMYLASSARITISRALRLMRPAGSVAIAAPEMLRVLLICPRSAGLGSTAEEVAVGRLTAALGARGGVEQVVGRATPDAIRSALRAREIHLVHFAGHSVAREGGAEVHLDGEAGGTLRLPAVEFAELFRDRPSIRLLVLSACEGARWPPQALTAVAPQLVRAGVPAVIAMQSRIPDSAARIFSSTFYADLAAGDCAGNVEAALGRARAALFVDRLALPIFASPVLYLHAEDGVLWGAGTAELRDLATAVERNAARARKELDPAILPRIPRCQVGDKILPAILASLTAGRSRIIPVVGAAGSGKSTLLGEIFDRLRQEERVRWLGLVGADELAAAGPGDLDVAVSRALCRSEVPFGDLAARLGRAGPGVLLLDTLDLILTPSLVPQLQRLLHDLEGSATTVVMTCRDHDYQLLLEPARERLRQVAERIDRYELKPFEPSEVEAAASAFVAADPRLRGTPAGGAFARRILALSADDRPIQEIVRNPLLLAMLCDLFGAAGDVPGDLTVSELYDGFWEKKVAASRMYGPRSAVPLAKRGICMAIAERLVEVSGDHLQEVVEEADLALAATEPVALARDELLSEGVLRSPAVDRLRYFHQTFLEYGMARWLASRAGEQRRERLLSGLARDGGAELLPLYWWPVVRQLLIRLDAVQWNEVASRLPLAHLAVFRALAFAAVGRGDGAWLASLGSSALRLGAEAQRLLCTSVEAAPAGLSGPSWAVLTDLLRGGVREGSVAVARAAGRLLGRPGEAIGDRFSQLLAAMDDRLREQGLEEDSELLGQLVSCSLPAIEAGLDPLALALLQRRYRRFGQRIRAAVLRLFASPRVPDAAREEMLEQLMSEPHTRSLARERTALMEQVLRARRAASPPLGRGWAMEVPGSWQAIQARALGRLAREDGTLLDEAIADLATAGYERRHTAVSSLRAAIEDGQGAAVAARLLRLDRRALDSSRLESIAGLIAALAPPADPTLRRDLALWLQPAAAECLESVLRGFGAVADAEGATWDLLVRGIQGYAEAGRLDLVLRVVGAVRPECRGRLAPAIEALAAAASPGADLEVALVRALGPRLGVSQEAGDRVLVLALSQRKNVALAAARELSRRAAEGEPPAAGQLLALTASPYAGVHAFLLQALAALHRQGGVLSDADLVRLCEGLRGETNPSARLALCALVGVWIKDARRVPAGVMVWLGELTSDESSRLDMGLVRELIRTLKVAAQLEARELLPWLEPQAARLLAGIDLNRVHNGEAEMIDLLSALARCQPDLLARLVEMGPRLPVRSVTALVLALRRVEGVASTELSRILASPWCPPTTRSLILKLRRA